jgi:hypothetical protein
MPFVTVTCFEKNTNLFEAFILYRQHHQTSVVSQHRGLSNPEISKIIGEQWRDESDETKAYWKKLAEVSETLCFE